MYKRFFKRFLDIFCSLSALFCLAPIFLFLIIWIRLDSPGPVLFKQKRVGKNKVHFNILKFRTMRTDAPHDMPTHLFTNPEQYITKSGRFLRKTSLDELPQIINILKGEMSVVGPRPALWNQYDLLDERDRYAANDVTPGLTGWAQVNGRDEIGIVEKARLDGEYVRNLTFKMDATCFLMTIGNVLKQQGVVEGGTGALAPHLEARREEVKENDENEEIEEEMANGWEA